MLAALERQGWDLVVGDHSMPAFSSTAALALLRERGLDVPSFVFRARSAKTRPWRP